MKKILLVLAIVIATVNFSSCNKQDSDKHYLIAQRDSLANVIELRMMEKEALMTRMDEMLDTVTPENLDEVERHYNVAKQIYKEYDAEIKENQDKIFQLELVINGK